MEVQRANWLEKKLARFKMSAIVKAIQSGIPSQMPWTDLPLGLGRACSTQAELHEAPRTVKTSKGAFGFLKLRTERACAVGCCALSAAKTGMLRVNAVPPILTRCPRTNGAIPTGLDSDVVVLETLPNVPIPVICSACGSTHYWMGFNAWVEGDEPQLVDAPTTNRNMVAR